LVTEDWLCVMPKLGG